LEELDALCRSAGLAAQAAIRVRRRTAHPALFIGGGKADEIRELAAKVRASAVVFNRDLSAPQQRNLERVLGKKVIDRSGLILDIFARRARSFEGKLQVELARGQYALSKLAGGWTHLERQRGGIGLRGGPGEAQIEIDRRLISARIATLRRRIDKLENRRRLARRARRRRGAATIALVGYTNAGKTTLFRRLLGAKNGGGDARLFDTLDTTARKLWLGGDAADAVLTDTVGFIDNLPHPLIAGFRATLADAAFADCLIHVADGASARCGEEIAVVDDTLRQIGAGDIPRIVAWNKMDLRRERAPAAHPGCDKMRAVLKISALTGEGIDALKASLRAALARAAA
jgi:GTP-binding protein HflX